ncbi:MAG TPA: sulfatase-like hydrolase/transferase [Planctomycetota bacterium]|nr:sulfatase-like hydrolase/transferase [Planctomycetota bacterium]
MSCPSPLAASLAALVACVACGVRDVRAGAPDRRPNIILILADDMGFSDIGCYGSEISTPNLDRLAAGGLRFTQFYNTARCCPTRAALLTGLYPHQAGIGHMVQDRGAPGYRGILNDRCVTIAEALRPAGYHTLMCGKWHVGENRPHWPTDRGFEKYYGLISGASSYFRLDPERQMAIDDRPHVPDERGFYLTDAISDRAAALVDEYGRKEKPFFLYVAYTAPHWPLHALPEDIARYRGKYLEGWDALRRERHARMVAAGIVEEKWGITPRDPDVPAWSDVKDREAWDLKMAVYAAQIDRMDQGIGRILARLKDAGAEENTLVLFLADNGGCAENIDSGKRGVPPGGVESFMSYGPPWANASNTPFRLYKHWVHEGGIATPLIAYWPSVIRRPAITHRPGHVIDILATVIDAAGTPYPKTLSGRDITPLEGRSLVPIFRGEEREDQEALFWEHEGNRAVRRGKWKLVSRHPGGWELYDLEADRTEREDLAREHPELVRDLAALYAGWAERAGVLTPEELKRRGRARQEKADASAALRRAVEYFRTRVAVEGGYLWRYSEDLALREGEGKASATTVWVQPPGTPAVGMAFLRAFEATADPCHLEAAQEAARALVRGQLESGGWDYRIEFDPADRKRHHYRVDGADAGQSRRNVTTLDDDTTQAAVRFLMSVDRALDFKDASIHGAAQYALGSILRAQYPNGAWPQRYERFPGAEILGVERASYPRSWPREYPGGSSSASYMGHYTLNDGVLSDLIDTLLEAALVYGDERYRGAALRCGEFILGAQMPDPQPAWAQQYDAGMQPAWARKFEPPAVTGGESQGVMRTLLVLYRETGERKYLDSVSRALAYLRRSRLPDGRLARFYELETNRPLYFTKDYKLVYSDGDLPAHYSFKVADRTERIGEELERLEGSGQAPRVAPQVRAPPRLTDELAARARAVIASLDDRGRWLEEGKLRHADPDGPARKVIDCGTFIENAGVLCDYLMAMAGEDPD